MKKKILAYFLCLSLVIGLVPLQGTKNIVKAASELPVYDTDVTEPSDGCVLVGIEGQYAANVQKALDRINEIRLEACEEGVQMPGNAGSRLKVSDYVPIKWSYDLEYIARIRAAEAIIRNEHTRPNGQRCFSLQSPNGISSYGEVLAWNFSNSMLGGIEQWYDEKEDWVKQTGAVTGHYTQMIDPDNTYIGLGCFLSNKGEWSNCTSGEFSSSKSLTETQMGNLGKCIQKVEILKSLLGTAGIEGNTSLKVGESSALSMVVPYKGRDSKLKIMSAIKWQSSSPFTASVDEDGMVTAISSGKAIITASSEDGFSTTATVTISASEDNVAEPTGKPQISPDTDTPSGITDNTVNAPSKLGKAKIKSVKKMKKGVVKLGIKKVQGADYYQIQYSTKKNFKTKKTIITTSTSVKLSLKPKKKYYIRIRACKDGNSATGYKDISGSWSSVKKVKTKK